MSHCCYGLLVAESVNQVCSVVYEAVPKEANMQIIKLPDGRKYRWYPKVDRWEEWDVCDRRWDPYWEETEILERLAKAEKILWEVTFLDGYEAELAREYFAEVKQ